MADEMRAVGRVLKSHGKRGEVVVHSAHDLSSYLQEGMRVALVPPPLKRNRFRTITSIKEHNQNFLVSFNGICDISAAQDFVGCTILVDTDELPADFDMKSKDRLLGHVVVDSTFGELGCIEEILSSSAQDTWVIRGAFGEIMIPAVPEFVQDMQEDGSICVSVPESLVKGVE